jgi:hypothetical protein
LIVRANVCVWPRDTCSARCRSRTFGLQRLIGAGELFARLAGEPLALFQDGGFTSLLGKGFKLQGEGRLLGERLSQFDLARLIAARLMMIDEQVADGLFAQQHGHDENGPNSGAQKLVAVDQARVALHVVDRERARVRQYLLPGRVFGSGQERGDTPLVAQIVVRQELIADVGKARHGPILGGIIQFDAQAVGLQLITDRLDQMGHERAQIGPSRQGVERAGERLRLAARHLLSALALLYFGLKRGVGEGEFGGPLLDLHLQFVVETV